MLCPVVVVHESKSRIADLLRARSPDRRWVLRQPRDLQECRGALPPRQSAVLVLEVEAGEEIERGRSARGHLVKTLEFMDWVHQNRPDTAILAVLGNEAAPPSLLLSEFGAKHVVAFERIVAELPEVVGKLIDKQWESSLP